MGTSGWRAAGWRGLAWVATVTASVAAAVIVAPGVGNAAATGLVSAGGGSLNVRTGASTEYPTVRQLPDGAPVIVRCQLDGDGVDGSQRSTSRWDQLADGGFVSDAFIAWPHGRPALVACDRGETSESVFVATAGRFAQQMRARYPVPASVIVAQAILESGWGRSSLSRAGNNFFGMKCFGSPGAIAIGCRQARTSECRTNDCYATSDSFRVYDSAWDSFADHASLLSTSERYQTALGYVSNPDAFARALERAGYATDPQYAEKLINVMRVNNLYRFDRSST